MSGWIANIQNYNNVILKSILEEKNLLEETQFNIYPGGIAQFQ